MAKSKQLPGQQDLFNVLGITPQNDSKQEKKPCHLCDNHRGCDNCYYGQVETKILNEYCEDCSIELSEWRPLGDNYCRDCGRKLK